MSSSNFWFRPLWLWVSDVVAFFPGHSGRHLAALSFQQLLGLLRSGSRSLVKRSRSDEDICFSHPVSIPASASGSERGESLHAAHGSGGPLFRALSLAGQYRPENTVPAGDLPHTLLAESARLAELCAGSHPGSFLELRGQFGNPGDDLCRPDDPLQRTGRLWLRALERPRQASVVCSAAFHDDVATNRDVNSDLRALCPPEPGQHVLALGAVGRRGFPVPGLSLPPVLRGHSHRPGRSGDPGWMRLWTDLLADLFASVAAGDRDGVFAFFCLGLGRLCHPNITAEPG